jgi:hypothetical protein
MPNLADVERELKKYAREVQGEVDRLESLLREAKISLSFKDEIITGLRSIKQAQSESIIELKKENTELKKHKAGL